MLFTAKPQLVFRTKTIEWYVLTLKKNVTKIDRVNLYFFQTLIQTLAFRFVQQNKNRRRIFTSKSRLLDFSSYYQSEIRARLSVTVIIGFDQIVYQEDSSKQSFSTSSPWRQLRSRNFPEDYKWKMKNLVRCFCFRIEGTTNLCNKIQSIFIWIS